MSTSQRPSPGHYPNTTRPRLSRRCPSSTCLHAIAFSESEYHPHLSPNPLHEARHRRRTRRTLISQPRKMKVDSRCVRPGRPCSCPEVSPENWLYLGTWQLVLLARARSVAVPRSRDHCRQDAQRADHCCEPAGRGARAARAAGVVGGERRVRGRAGCGSAEMGRGVGTSRAALCVGCLDLCLVSSCVWRSPYPLESP